MNRSRLAFALSTLLTLAIPAAAAGCADNTSAVKPLGEPSVQTTTAAAPPRGTRTMGVSNDLASACKLDFGNVNSAPKFDFDKSDLPPEDRDVLGQIAKCVTVGPMKGRGLQLVGRTDPRGESEYNLGLGEHRADAVAKYLEALGVPSGQLGETSRGKLDANGTDEATWRRDRRVDIMLR